MTRLDRRTRRAVRRTPAVRQARGELSRHRRGAAGNFLVAAVLVAGACLALYVAWGAR